jgi:hypothetical protein
MLEKTHKEIKLPKCGESVTVRQLRQIDYAHIGAIPDNCIPSFLDLIGKDNVPVTDLDPQTADFLLKAVARSIVKHPEKLRLTEKQPEHCTEKECSLYEIETEDLGALMDGCFSGGEGLPLDFLEAIGRYQKARADASTENT